MSKSRSRSTLPGAASRSEPSSTDLLGDQVLENQRRIKTTSYAMSLGELTAIYERGELDIHPEFQRQYRWDNQQKSDLVESVLLGIPIPPIFVSQRSNGVWDVVDGLQRLSTIFELQHKLRDQDDNLLPPLQLTATRYLPLLKGKRWPEEPEQHEDPKNFLGQAEVLEILRAKFDIKIILRSSDTGQEYDLFWRLNTSGSPLSDQEVRNSLLIMTAGSDALRRLRELASSDSFQESTGISDKAKAEQYDLELVLRFLIMYRLPIEELRTGLRDLNRFLNERMISSASDGTLFSAKARSDFNATFDVINGAFGINAFRRYDHKKRAYSGGFLVSAFEIIALGVGNNITAWKAASRRSSLEPIVKRAWSSTGYLSRPRMGVPATARIPEAVTEGRKLFKK